MKSYKFIMQQNIYDPEVIFYSLEHDGVEKNIGGVRFLEVTPDFKKVQLVRADSLTPIGIVNRDY